MKTILKLRSSFLMILILIIALIAPGSFVNANKAPQDSTCITPPPGVLSWWSGDGHPFDLVGENDATLTNGASYAGGIVRRAFSFDGLDDYLSVPNSASLQAVGDHFSIEAWVRPESLPSGDPYYDKGIVVREGYVRGFALATKGAAFGMWIGGANDTGLAAVSSPITTDRWYHVVGTYDGSDARIYVDGELEGTQAAPLIHYDTPLMIGTSQINERFFDGQIDEVTIYNRALTAQEILTLFGGCTTSAPADMVLYWPFDDGTGPTLDELMGSYDGTLTNGPLWAAGKIGSALSFDGVDDYVALPDAASELLKNDAGAISVWVNPSAVVDNDIVVGFGDTGTCYGSTIGLGIWNVVRPWHCIGGYDWHSTTPVNPNIWTHLAYTWDTTTEYIYKNGQFTESRPRNFSYIAGQARIGNGWWGDPANAYPGLIDELKVFDRALTAGEVESLFDFSCPGKCKPCFPPPEDMVSWWPFNEDEGAAAEEIIASNDGTLHGAVWAAGKAGNALSFDGTDDYVSTSDSPLWDLGGADFTLEAWVNPVNTGGVNRLISAGGQNDGANNLWSFGYGTHPDWGSGNRLSLDYYDGSGYTRFSSDEVKLGLGLWNHLAFVRSGASLSFYLNGLPAGSREVGTVAFGGGSTGAIIAARYLDDPSTVIEFAHGLIDEVGLYQRALSAAEIAAIFAADCSGKCIPDTTSPEVASIVRADPDPTNASSVNYSVAFTEPVEGVDVADFNLTATAGPSDNPISSVIDSGDHTVYTVTVEIEPEFAAVRLNIVEPVTIADLSGNPLAGLPFFGETYTIDRTPPAILSLLQTSANPVSGGTVGYTLRFSEVVEAAGASDFELTTTGSIAGASIDAVIEHVDQSGFDFILDTGSGEGTLRLDIALGAEITDRAGNPLPDLPFTSAEAYVVDRTAPYVVSITRLDPSPSFASSVDFLVTFSEAVEALDGTDFYLTLTGTLVPQPIASIVDSGEHLSYTVTVSTGTGSGTMGLNVHQSSDVSDLAGNPLAGLPYTGGETYEIRIAYIYLPVIKK